MTHGMGMRNLTDGIAGLRELCRIEVCPRLQQERRLVYLKRMTRFKKLKEKK